MDGTREGAFGGAATRSAVQSPAQSLASGNNPIVIEEGKDYLLEPDDELPYELLRNLGHGHSGNVEEVRDTHSGAVFARKTIRITGLTATREARTRIFNNEIKVIRSLAGHHHIIRVFATYVSRREVGLILQPVANHGDLEDFLSHCREGGNVGGHMNPDVQAILKRAFGCLASGLAFMHDHKIRHKDIKPRNILIHQGHVIFTDFGYSLDSSGLSHSTTAGRPDFLTRRYCAPEVLDHDLRNSKSDIFSLGCVFIEMYSVLVNASFNIADCYGTSIETIREKLYEPRPRQRRWEGVRDLCGAMTQREPKDRPPAYGIVFRIASFYDLRYFCGACATMEKEGGPAEQERVFSDHWIFRPYLFQPGRVLEYLYVEPRGRKPCGRVLVRFGNFAYLEARAFISIDEVEKSVGDFLSCLSIDMWKAPEVSSHRNCIVHTTEIAPVMNDREYGTFMVQPIRVLKASGAEHLPPSSRIEFGLVYTIDSSLRRIPRGDERGIGDVCPEHWPLVLKYHEMHKQERNPITG